MENWVVEDPPRQLNGKFHHFFLKPPFSKSAEAQKKCPGWEGEWLDQLRIKPNQPSLSWGLAWLSLAKNSFASTLGGEGYGGGLNAQPL